MKGKCTCCGRPLTDPISIAIGYGKKCAAAAGIKVAASVWDMDQGKRSDYAEARRGRREARKTLSYLTGENGMVPLFPEFDTDAIERTEKEKWECELKMAKAMKLN